MASAFKPCRACGEPVFVGAKRCPKCRARTSWRSRPWTRLFALLIPALVAVIVGGALFLDWDREGDAPADSAPAPSSPSAATSSTPPALANGERSRSTTSTPARVIPETAAAAGNRSVAALQRRDSENAVAISVRGKRIEPGMSADSMFELVTRQELLDQTIEPDPFNPPNLQFIKYYRVDGKEFSVELRKATPSAPYRVTRIRLLRPDERKG